MSARFSDTAGDTRKQPAEALLDTCNGPGLALLLVGIIALGSTLTAAASGTPGWLALGAATSLVCLAAGLVVVVTEVRHARAPRTDARELERARG
ncbi:hypothetical protein [Nocardia sp. NPDC005978]|uniref:hypothetical protein n=1 Tax=unclassified Nocardia TaxID=2637762 RepID=UPI0033B794DD